MNVDYVPLKLQSENSVKGHFSQLKKSETQSQRPQQNTSRGNQETTLCERVYESICIWPEKGQSTLSKEAAGKQTGTWKALVYMKQND